MSNTQALLEKEDPANLQLAIDELNAAAKVDTRNASLHRFFAIAYGRQGKEALAKLELAEEAVLDDKPRTARRMASDAMRALPAGSREWLRAQDLIAASLAHKSHESSDEDSAAGVHFSVGPVGGTSGSGFGPPNSGFAQRP